jgi:hypothetical protein
MTTYLSHLQGTRSAILAITTPHYVTSQNSADLIYAAAKDRNQAWRQNATNDVSYILTNLEHANVCKSEELKPSVCSQLIIRLPINQSINNFRMQVFKLMQSFHQCGIDTVKHPVMRVDHPSWHVLLLNTALPIIVLLNPGLIGSLEWWLYVEGQKVAGGAATAELKTSELIKWGIKSTRRWNLVKRHGCDDLHLLRM